MSMPWIILGWIALAVLAFWPRRARHGTGDVRSAENDEGDPEACMLRHDFQGALAESAKAIQADPHDALSHFHRANAHHALGNLEQAVADYSRAIEIHELQTLEVCGQ